MVGYTKATYPGTDNVNWGNVHPDDAKIIKQKLGNALKPGLDFIEFEARVKHRRGHWVWVLVKGMVAATDQNGMPVHLIGIRMDISKRKHAEIALKEYQEGLKDLIKERTIELEITNKDLETFAYSISHELKNPLRHIAGFTELIEDYMTQHKIRSEKIQVYFNHIKKSINDMFLMTNALLKFAKIGKQELNKEVVNMQSLIHDIIENLKVIEQNRNIKWTVEELLPVNADPELLRQVFENIIENAVKFTVDNEVAEILIGCYSQEGKNVYFVKDNGIGFNPQYSAKLFGVFEKLHPSEKFSGLGIGLAKAKKIISNHKGEVWAESKAGNGATFYIKL